MRELIEIEKKSEAFKLTDEVILHWGKILNIEKMLHIETVYFTENGSGHFVCHKIGDKKYTMLSVKKEPYERKDGSKATRLTKYGEPKNEIIFEISAKDLINKYIKLLKNKK